MKVINVIVIIILLIVPAAVFAQEDGAYVYQKPRVLFNTRGSSEYEAFSQMVDINTSWGYKTFADMARADGYICSQQHITTITKALLANYDILVLPVPYSPTAAETTVLKDFINDGGGVLLMVDLSDKYDHLANWGVFLKEYGIGFSGKNYSNTSMNILQNVVLSQPWPANSIKVPIKDSPTPPTQWVGTYLTVDKKKALAAVKENSTKKIFAAIPTTHLLGKGRIAVLGDWLLFNSGSWRGQVPIGQNDNLFFSRDVLHYLAGASDLTAEYITPDKKEYAVGQLLKSKIKLTNEGTQSSFATYVEVYLSKKKVLYNKKNIKYLVDTFNLNAIHPDKIRIKNFKAKVPSGVKPGKYWLVIDIQPERIFDDLYYDNNIVRSTSKITITK